MQTLTFGLQSRLEQHAERGNDYECDFASEMDTCTHNEMFYPMKVLFGLFRGYKNRIRSSSEFTCNSLQFLVAFSPGNLKIKKPLVLFHFETQKQRVRECESERSGREENDGIGGDEERNDPLNGRLDVVSEEQSFEGDEEEVEKVVEWRERHEDAELRVELPDETLSRCKCALLRK